MYEHACVLTTPVSFVFQDLGQHNRPAKKCKKKWKNQTRDKIKNIFLEEKNHKKKEWENKSKKEDVIVVGKVDEKNLNKIKYYAMK